MGNSLATTQDSTPIPNNPLTAAAPPTPPPNSAAETLEKPQEPPSDGSDPKQIGDPDTLLKDEQTLLADLEKVEKTEVKDGKTLLGDGGKVEGIEGKDEGVEEEEEGECGFCLFMKGGGCRESFIAWEECVEEGGKTGEDIVEKCFKVTHALKECMIAHADYYGPILEAERAAEDRVVEELEREKEKEKEREPAEGGSPVVSENGEGSGADGVKKSEEKVEGERVVAGIAAGSA